jgi:manganese transport protein
MRLGLLTERGIVGVVEDHLGEWWAWLLVAAVALLSVPGAIIGRQVLGQLVLVLALGTVGTPFAIAVVLYLLNSQAVPWSNSTLANVSGIALLLVSGTLAVNFVRELVGGGVDLLSGSVLAFAIALGLVIIVLFVTYVHERLWASDAAVESAD